MDSEENDEDDYEQQHSHGYEQYYENYSKYTASQQQTTMTTFDEDDDDYDDDDDDDDYNNNNNAGLSELSLTTTTSIDTNTTTSSTTTTTTTTLSFAQRFLAKQGYVEGQGLGKDGEGRTNPIEFDRHNRKKGLGYEEDPLDDFYTPQTHTLDDEELDFPSSQQVNWIKTHNKPFIYQDHSSFIKIGYEGEVPNRSEFCSSDLIDTILYHKTGLDHLDGTRFYEARKKSNPYESIKGSIFINRAAVKMANLDKLANLLSPIKTIPHKPSGFLYFADICAGPGGFTEYMYWRKTNGGKKLRDNNLNDIVKGFGFTIKGDCDWNTKNFSRFISIDNFQKEYGLTEDGDILVSDNIRHFAQRVADGTNNQGVQLCMGDGGVNTEGKENLQELILQQLILCQFLTMFEVLAEGGNFVCKIFDTFNPFTVGLLYLIYSHFEEFAIVKPFTSRPLNSERYVIGRNLLVWKSPVIKYLYEINDLINNKQNVLEIVNKDHMDDQFKDYIRQSSESICRNQIKAFVLFKKFVEDRDLQPPDQREIRNRCLKEWNLPFQSKYDIERDRSNSPKHNNNSNNNHQHHSYPHKRQQQQFLDEFTFLKNQHLINDEPNNNNNNNNHNNSNGSPNHHKYKKNYKNRNEQNNNNNNNNNINKNSPNSKGVQKGNNGNKSSNSERIDLFTLLLSGPRPT
ncbi:hypothetical protein CYY_009263 [Polysphondylium violaceum]|uniref:Cap-specific mRNA (nucleoside-2'-O-)-methyltransferase 1 n=1 Tax=Polysphondylium violaceum TaxID=133409 RepID=A0A8J4PTX9_9MYCE|nr:hypothetical protein CYY_009263 [Polysphondylium violaceum]